MPRTFISLFAGVGGIDLGLEEAGWECRAQVEWDPACQQVLARHWPDVPRWGDVRDVSGYELPPVEMITFGSPCQDLSVAGKRAGLSGERSGLFYEAVRIIKEMRDATESVFPRWAVWENVAGAFSSNGGADFGAVLDALAECGAVDISWACLDAQWFGVPQRRRRVFVVACFDPAIADVSPDPLLPVAPRSGWDHPPRRAPWQATSPAARRGAASGRGLGADRGVADAHVSFVKVVRSGARDADGTLPAEVWRESEVSPTLTAFDNGGEARATVLAIGLGTDSTVSGTLGDPRTGGFRGDLDTAGAYVVNGEVVAIAENQRGEVRLSEVVPSMATTGGKPGQGYPAVVVPVQAETVIPIQDGREIEKRQNGLGIGEPGAPAYTIDTTGAQAVAALGFDSTFSAQSTVQVDVAPPLKVGSTLGIASPPATMTPELAVRRLTPLECERLMGWPDDHTRWRADGTEVKDTGRYKMCGNGVASPVAAWIGRHIAAATALVYPE